MKHHVLVVEKDPVLIEEVRDCLDSLENTYDCACSQETARTYLRSRNYSYVILAMDIPVKFGRPSRVRNGLSLLFDIRKNHDRDDLPVIAMSSQGLDSPDLAVEALRDGGANDFVKKPFPALGDTLEKRILDVLERVRRPIKAWVSSMEEKLDPTLNEPPKLFEGGEMVFSEHRVELGVGGPSSKRDDPIKDHFNENCLNDRQEWILEHLGKGGRLQKQHVVKQFGCSPTTAKRDLTELNRLKLIKYEGPQKTGSWVLDG